MALTSAQFRGRVNCARECKDNDDPTNNDRNQYIRPISIHEWYWISTKVREQFSLAKLVDRCCYPTRFARGRYGHVLESLKGPKNVAVVVVDYCRACIEASAMGARRGLARTNAQSLVAATPNEHYELLKCLIRPGQLVGTIEVQDLLPARARRSWCAPACADR